MKNQLEGFFFLPAMRLWKHFFPLLYYMMSYLGRLGLWDDWDCHH